MTNELHAFSDALAAAVERAGQSTVRVDARRRQAASGIVWSADGVIVTAHHVVQREEEIGVGLPNGETVTASLVGRDPSIDLAVLRAEATGLTAPNWVDGETIRVGHLVVGVGRPGQNVQASLGLVSVVGGAMMTPGGGRIEGWLRPDLVMYPGFSGGPLVGSEGHLLGMNTSALLRGSAVTLSAATISQVVETLLAHGHIRRGYLGVGVQTVQLPASVAEATGQTTGVLLNSVETDSPAEQSGLLVGDIVVSLDGEPVRHPDDLSALLYGKRAGQSVPISLVRAGQRQEMTVNIGERV